METKSSTPLGIYYEEHHASGKRLGQSFMEDVRGRKFRSWIGTDKAVLDLGGRDGVLTRHFIEGNQVTIGDIDCAALAHARASYPVETAEVNLNEALPFADQSFDVVVMAEVLEHLPYVEFTLSEVRRVLRPGGRFVGSIPLAYHLKDRWQVLRGRKLWMAGDPTHLQFFKYDELLAALAPFFELKDAFALKGGRKAARWPRLFARVISFHCVKGLA